jgi:hypothetical protein
LAPVDTDLRIGLVAQYALEQVAGQGPIQGGFVFQSTAAQRGKVSTVIVPLRFRGIGTASHVFSPSRSIATQAQVIRLLESDFNVKLAGERERERFRVQ